MNFDKNLMFCEEQAITNTAVSTNTIAVGDNDISIGGAVPLFVFVNEQFEGEATDLTIKIEANDKADFTGETKTLFEAKTLTEDLFEGAVLQPKYMPTGAKGFVRLQFIVNGASFTAGKITAGVVDAIHEDCTDL